MKNKNIFWLVGALSFVFHLAGWVALRFSFSDKVQNEWTWPIIFFFLGTALLGLSSIIQSQKKLMAILLLSCYSPVFITAFQHWFWMILAMVISILIALAGAGKIEAEKNNRIKICPDKLVRYGFSYFTTALAALISVAYYFSLVSNPAQTGEPHFKIEMPPAVIDGGLKFASTVFPGPEMKLIADGATVDQFIQQGITNSSSSDGTEQLVSLFESQQGRQATEQEKAIIEENLKKQTDNQALIEQSRANLSRQFGVSLSGDEQMKQVFADLVNKKINSFFNADEENGSVVPVGLSLALFLTIKSIAWLLGIFCVWTIWALFRIMVKTGLINIVKIAREVESIA